MGEKSLIFKSFEVNMVYGFRTKPLSFKGFNELLRRKREPNNGHVLRDGWSTFYKMTSGNNDLIQNIVIEGQLKKKGPDYKEGDKPEGKSDDFVDVEYTLEELDDQLKEYKWTDSNCPLEFTLTRSFSIRRDGVGTVTLTLSFLEGNSNYSTSDILRTLMLAPRTIRQTDGELTMLKENITKPRIKSLEEKHWKTFSPAFRLFITSMAKLNSQFKGLIPTWEPKFNGEFVDEEYDIGNYKYTFYGSKGLCEELSYNADSQIPYFFVFAKNPLNQYREAFLEEQSSEVTIKQLNRAHYTKEISAILGRWLNGNNIKYASIEYWKKNSQMSNNSYETLFMNSLVFTVFSGMLALTIYPDTDKFENYPAKRIELIKKPINVTRETILRFLEFSRTRWHSAIVANYGLDLIINTLPLTQNGDNFLKLFEYLLKIQEMIALNFENPSHFLLDSSLGSSLTNFFNANIINEVEEEVSKKLDHTRKLLKDRWSFYEAIRSQELDNKK